MVVGSRLFQPSIEFLLTFISVIQQFAINLFGTNDISWLKSDYYNDYKTNFMKEIENMLLDKFHYSYIRSYKEIST